MNALTTGNPFGCLLGVKVVRVCGALKGSFILLFINAFSIGNPFSGFHYLGVEIRRDFGALNGN